LDLSVVVVNFNTRDLLADCLTSVQIEAAGIEHEVLVVDNGSTDHSVEMLAAKFPGVRVIANRTNLGFGRANNLALRQARGKAVLLLNPDTRVQPGAIKRLLEALWTLSESVAVGPRVVRPDGTLDLACRRSFPSPSVALGRLTGLSRLFPHSRTFAAYNRTYEDPVEPSEIDAGTAAAMCFTREALSAVGYFDEDFFMYGEDLDLCFRLKARGGRIYYVPDAVVLHIKGAASRQQGRRMLWEFHRAMWIFYRKHYMRGPAAALAPAIWLGIRLRYLLLLGSNVVRGRQVVSP
jgi:GT2 family glycosyltransferase